jgi:hypothetical protein
MQVEKHAVVRGFGDGLGDGLVEVSVGPILFLLFASVVGVGQTPDDAFDVLQITGVGA